MLHSRLKSQPKGLEDLTADIPVSFASFGERATVHVVLATQIVVLPTFVSRSNGSWASGRHMMRGLRG